MAILIREKGNQEGAVSQQRLAEVEANLQNYIQLYEGAQAAREEAENHLRGLEEHLQRI